MAYCRKCGTQLSEGANFCPKCGTPCDNNSIDSTTESEAAENVFIEDNSKSRTLRIVLLTLLVIVLIGGWYGYNSFTSKEKGVTPPEEEVSEMPIPTDDDGYEQTEKEAVPDKVDNSEYERMEEYKERAMEYGNQIQQIMTNINNVYNRYVSASMALDDIRKQSMGVNAVADISDLRLKGDKIFKELINLARQHGQQDALNMFKQEMDNFDMQAHQMERAITQDIYN